MQPKTSKSNDMNNAESTKMTFVKETNHGNQLVFEDVLGKRYKMSTKHFMSNMNSHSRLKYANAEGLPISGMTYSVILYTDTNSIALDRKVYLWELQRNKHTSIGKTRSYRDYVRYDQRRKKPTTTGEAVGGLIFSLFELGSAIWDYVYED